MDATRKYQFEWVNPIIKEHTWYALTDKWILALKLRIPNVQFTDQMKPKKKEDKSVDTWYFLKENKIPMVRDTERQIVQQ